MKDDVNTGGLVEIRKVRPTGTQGYATALSELC